MAPQSSLRDVARLLGAPTAELLLGEPDTVRELCLERVRLHLANMGPGIMLDPIALQRDLHQVVMKELDVLGRVDGLDSP